MGWLNLKIYTRKLKYEISLYSNVSIIVGDSATGKSKLIELVGIWENSKESGVSVESDLPIVILDNIYLKNRVDLGVSTRTLFLIDEDTKYLKQASFWEMFYRSKGYLLIISRSLNFPYVPIDTEAIYKLESEINNDISINRNIEMYNIDLLRPKKKTKIITEDSKSGLILCELLSFKEIESANGNTRIIKKVKQAACEEVTLFVDLIAFGYFMPLVLLVRYCTNRIFIANCKSTENILLLCKSLNVKEKELNYKKYDLQLSEYKSVERYFTKLLEEKSFKFLGFRYVKSAIDIKLIDDSVRKTMYEILWNPHDEKKSLLGILEEE